MSDQEKNYLNIIRDKAIKDKSIALHEVTIVGRGQVLTQFSSNVSTHSEYGGRNRYRGRYNTNRHIINTGTDQSINYFAKTAIRIMNNALKRSNTRCVSFLTSHCFIILQHLDKKYFINGNLVTKSRLNGIIPSLLMTLNICKSQDKMERRIDIAIATDPVISTAIVNKVEYTFYDKGKKVTTLLNLEKTSKETTAVELYEGVWCDFKDNKIKTFLASCRGNKNKFYAVSPEEIYYLSRGEFLSKSQIQTVYAFLGQNRKSTLVERRSMELFKDLTERFKGKIFEVSMFVESNDDEKQKMAMAVAGKQLDWVVVDRGYKQGRQDVSTYAIFSLSNYRKVTGSSSISWVCKDDSGDMPSLSGKHGWECAESKNQFLTIGPICIDQAHSGISLGDQFASRAMALLNDIHSFKHVSTLSGYSRYIPKDRVDWNAVSLLQPKPLNE